MTDITVLLSETQYISFDLVSCNTTFADPTGAYMTSDWFTMICIGSIIIILIIFTMKT